MSSKPTVLENIRAISADAKAELCDLKQFIYDMETRYLNMFSKTGPSAGKAVVDPYIHYQRPETLLYFNPRHIKDTERVWSRNELPLKRKAPSTKRKTAGLAAKRLFTCTK
jgi:hypothetical protein